MKKICTTMAQLLTAGMLMAFAAPASAQEAYPTKPIRLITAYPPGGTLTILARLVGQKLGENLGQQMIVENRPGGNTVIGTNALVKSAPDGYAIMFMDMTHVINANLMPNLPFDAIKDVAPIGTLSKSEVFLVAHPSLPANNLRELIALAKAKPGQLNFASGGTGTGTHLPGELLNMMAGIKMQHIPYKGGPQSLADVIGGQVHMAYVMPIVVIPHIKSGKVKAIAISGETHLSALPQVPTFTESGLPGFDVKIWYGALAPAGTPKPIIGKLSTELAKVLAMSEIKEQLVSRAMDPVISTPEQFAALMKADMAKFAKIIKTANIKLEQ